MAENRIQREAKQPAREYRWQGVPHRELVQLCHAQEPEDVDKGEDQKGDADELVGLHLLCGEAAGAPHEENPAQQEDNAEADPQGAAPPGAVRSDGEGCVNGVIQGHCHVLCGIGGHPEEQDHLPGDVEDQAGQKEKQGEYSQRREIEEA